MSYYFTKTVKMGFEEAINKVTEELASDGFGILTQIDVQATMKKKLGKDFRPYRILGACNPHMAFEALILENKIGTMLPCNVVVQELESGEVEVTAVDPGASMMAVDNPELKKVAGQVGEMLSKVIDRLS